MSERPCPKMAEVSMADAIYHLRVVHRVRVVDVPPADELIRIWKIYHPEEEAKSEQDNP